MKFEAAIDLDAHLAKAESGVDRGSLVLVRPQAFRLLCGEDDLSDVQFGPVVALNRFCRYCGIRIFGKGHLAKLGGDFCAVGLAAIDGVVVDGTNTNMDMDTEAAAAQ